MSEIKRERHSEERQNEAGMEWEHQGRVGDTESGFKMAGDSVW